MNKNKIGFCCMMFSILILLVLLNGCAQLQLLPEFSKPQNVVVLCVVTESHASLSIPETKNPELIDESVVQLIVDEFEKSNSVKVTSFSIEKKDVPGKLPRISGVQITFVKK